jgi:hypothetical protein
MLDLTDLTVDVRLAMLAEVEGDVTSGRLHLPARLTGAGRADYPGLMRAAAREHDARWLGEQLSRPGRFRVYSRPGQDTDRPGTLLPTASRAAPAVADDAFNRYYIRGLCRVARGRGEREVVVCRSRPLVSPDDESEAMVGCAVEAEGLLVALRTGADVSAALGCKRKGDAGLTVCLGRDLPSAHYPAREPARG